MKVYHCNISCDLILFKSNVQNSWSKLIRNFFIHLLYILDKLFKKIMVNSKFPFIITNCPNRDVLYKFFFVMSRNLSVTKSPSNVDCAYDVAFFFAHMNKLDRAMPQCTVSI